MAGAVSEGGTPCTVVAGPVGRHERLGEIPMWNVEVFDSLEVGRPPVASFVVSLRDVPDDGDVLDLIDARLAQDGFVRADAPRTPVAGRAPGVHMWTVWSPF